MGDIDTLREAVALLERAAGSGEPWQLRVEGPNAYVECAGDGRWVAYYCGDDPGAAEHARWIALMDPLTGRVLIDVFEGCVMEAERGGDVHPEWLALAEVLLTRGAGLFSS